ncbi:SNF2 helicase associated domain-containing protein [Candidatus Uhrbacteria bacterium]|nr:SNF2 helicase associated domain-containing protein [Candidatus Uhrbacteria bacterium]
MHRDRLFSEDILRDVADATSFARGKQYHKTGDVVEVFVEESSTGALDVHGKVRGSRLYRVSFSVSKQRERVTDYQCSCPYDWGGACKHVVALGLAAMESAEVTPIETQDRISGVLEEFVRKKRLGLNQKDIATLSKQLATLGVDSGRALARKKSTVREMRHPLDDIVLRLSYLPAKDQITVAADAWYGPLVLPVGDDSVEESMKEGSVVHRADRDVHEESRCEQQLVNIGEEDQMAGGRVMIRGEYRIYWFLKYRLPRLQEQYRVESDASMDALSIESETVDAQWETRVSSGINFFEFSTDWHVGASKISLEQLKQMVRSGKSYLRTADGSFIECANREEVERLLSFVEKAEEGKQGKLRLRLFDAPELMAAIEASKHSQMEKTNQAFSELLTRIKTGLPVVEPVFPDHLETTLRPYQKRGVAWAKFLQENQFGGILADDMGLGKTLQVLSLLSVSDRAQPSLIVCPKTLVHVWLAEAARFTPELKVKSVEGTPSQRGRIISSASKGDILVTSYSLMQRDARAYMKRTTPFFYTVLDEAQYIKNAATNSAKAVKLIKTEHRLALTGTPLENGLHELWSVFDFLMPGFLLDRRTFRQKYELPIGERKDKDALKKLREKVQPFMLRRTKESELKELPAKVEQTNLCELVPEQLVLYARTLEDVRGDLFRRVETKGFNRSRIEILTALLRLRQICNHPALVDKQLPRSTALSGKLEHALELIREARAGGHKVLCFSQFTSMLDIIRERLDEQGIGHGTIEGKTNDRAAEVRRFRDDPEMGVFLLSLKAGGTGLTLIEADTVILFDPWWNPMVERQAMDRAHRIGQKKAVNVYKLITKGTIEEKVLALQTRKRDLFEAVMANEEGFDVGRLTWEEVKGLFE